MELNGINILLLIVSVIVMAILSLFHIAHKNINRLKFEIDKKNSPKYGATYLKIVKNDSFFNNFIYVGYFLALILFVVSVDWSAPGYEWVKSLVLSVIILFSIGYYPKLMVRRFPDFYLKLLAFPTYLIFVILYPLSFVFYKISQLSRFLFKIENESTEDVQFSKDDLSLLLSEATGENGDDGADEKDVEILENALQLSEVKVRDCMIQTSDIEAVELNESVDDVKERFVMSNFSRLPIYRESIYNIIGYINVKQLFNSFNSCGDIMREIVYAPATMSAQKMLTLFTVNRNSIAAVINEFGESVGIITLEDVLEEIFGDIEDEYDSSDIIDYEVEDGEIIVSAKAQIDYLNAKYATNIPQSDNYDTLAGYILDFTHSIPLRGEVVKFENMMIKIIKRNERRIDLVKITVEKR